jgi:hypothetical protein
VPSTYVLVVELVLLDELGDGDDVLQAVPEQVSLLAKEPLAVITCTVSREGWCGDETRKEKKERYSRGSHDHVRVMEEEAHRPLRSRKESIPRQ